MEIVPNVHRIPAVRGANVYLLLGERLTLVDCGMPGNSRAVLDYVRGLGRAPGDLACIVLTHHHADHTGSLAALVDATGARVLAHAGDAPFINGQQPSPPPRAAGMRLLFRLMPSITRSAPVPVDTVLQDGETLEILGGATAVHAPGHTPGSVCLYFPTEKLLVSGDVINRRGSRLALPPALFTEDMGQATASIRRLAALDFEVLCPGHGAPIVRGAAGEVRAMLESLE